MVHDIENRCGYRRPVNVGVQDLFLRVIDVGVVENEGSKIRIVVRILGRSLPFKIYERRAMITVSIHRLAVERTLGNTSRRGCRFLTLFPETRE